MREVIFGLLLGLSIAKLAVVFLETKAVQGNKICTTGKPRVYFQHNGKWATAELLRLGETCYE
jgi:hypothetical protein